MYSRFAAIAIFAAVIPTSPAGADQIAAVCFTPGQDCTGMIVAEIAAARSQILVQAYSFTSRPIEIALVEAKRHGADVEAILDRSNGTEQYSGAEFIANAGIPVLYDSIGGIAHNKVIVIDGYTVITGSFNFTKAAQDRNAENVLVIRDRAIADLYAANWHQRAGQSAPSR